MEAQIGVLLEKGPRRVSPFLVPMMMANAGGATVSMRLGGEAVRDNHHRVRVGHALDTRRPPPDRHRTL